MPPPASGSPHPSTAAPVPGPGAGQNTPCDQGTPCGPVSSLEPAGRRGPAGRLSAAGWGWLGATGRLASAGRLGAAARWWAAERPGAGRTPSAATALAVVGGTLAGTTVDRLAACLAVVRTNCLAGGPLGALRVSGRIRPPGFPHLLRATGRQVSLEVSATASYGELCRLRRGCDAAGNTWDDPAYALMSLFGGYAGVFGDSCGPVLGTGAVPVPASAPRSRWTEITYGGGERISVGTEIDLGNRSLPIRIIGIPLVRDGRLALLPDEIVLGNQRLPGELMTPADTAVFAEPVVILPEFPRGTRLADAVATPEGLRLRFERRAPARR